jgi:hypothetical protein
MSTFYKADSIRIKANGYDGIGVRFGRFAAEIHEYSIKVIESDEADCDPAEKYGCLVANGCECWGFATVADAFAAGEEFMRRSGWTQDREAAKAAAIDLARSRHEIHKVKSTNYARRFAGE